jgi:DNA-binding transcriptional LysR family regulator
MLKDAGDALNTNRSSLPRTIRNVETAIGEPVLTDHARNAPVHLTPTGHRLLRQAAQHRE